VSSDWKPCESGGGSKRELVFTAPSAINIFLLLPKKEFPLTILNEEKNCYDIE
jgi:hypothetical protein